TSTTSRSRRKRRTIASSEKWGRPHLLARRRGRSLVLLKANGDETPNRARPIWKARSSFSITARSTDRKSTRLNSSHVKISYAVFCLKKKKHKDMTHSQDIC